MLRRQIMLFFILALLLPFSIFAQNVQIFEISAPEVKQMIDQEKPLIVNVLSPLEFKLQHIPGSINIPINTLDKSTLLPVEKDRPLVFYCMNPK